MKTLVRGLFVSVLFIVAGWAVTVVGQGGPGGVGVGIPCTFDCYDIFWMGGRQNGEEYCWWFEYQTGRLVWSNQRVPTGGMPHQDVGSQTGARFVDCPPECDFWTETPQELAGDLFDGRLQVGEFGFGKWHCSG